MNVRSWRFLWCVDLSYFDIHFWGYSLLLPFVKMKSKFQLAFMSYDLWHFHSIFYLNSSSSSCYMYCFAFISSIISRSIRLNSCRILTFRLSLCSMKSKTSMTVSRAGRTWPLLLAARIFTSFYAVDKISIRQSPLVLAAYNRIHVAIGSSFFSRNRSAYFIDDALSLQTTVWSLKSFRYVCVLAGVKMSFSLPLKSLKIFIKTFVFVLLEFSVNALFNWLRQQLHLQASRWTQIALMILI